MKKQKKTVYLLPIPQLCICSAVGKLTAQKYLSENCLVPVSELCRYPKKQQSVGTLPTPPRVAFSPWGMTVETRHQYRTP